ncbi:MAG: FHA domain-containing protein [Dehalococcoidia bacterium]|nr:FHA domain-containing protein [Dehalococcoidia bacterium]
MNDSVELLTLRLALIGIVFFFVLAAAFALRSGLRPRAVAAPRVAPEPRRSGARLVLTSPAGTGIAPGTEFFLAGEMSLGRDATNGIVLPDASVSGRHAVVEYTRTGWRMADLGSTNGTMVNGRTLDGRAVPLQGGEQIVLGAVVLRFQP